MTEVTLLIDSGDIDDADADHLSIILFNDLRAVGLVEVSRTPRDAPAGSKSGTVSTIGELVLSGVFSVATVTAIAKVIISYLDRTKARSVSWSDGNRVVKITAVSKRDQRRLVEKLFSESAGSRTARSREVNRETSAPAIEKKGTRRTDVTDT